MARPSQWRRYALQLNLPLGSSSGLTPINPPTIADGWTIVRLIGTITYNIEPTEFTGRVAFSSGIVVTNDPSPDPRHPDSAGAEDWLYWDYQVLSPNFSVAEATGETRWGPVTSTHRFDVHGARVLFPDSQGLVPKFAAGQDTSGDPAGAINVFLGVSALFLLPAT